MSSLHLGAKLGDIAETVLLPGDPLRAKYVADNLLENAVCYNNIRGMLGFTGYFNGKRVSIQSTGMGMGSAGIYIHELINTYKVKNLIRVGTCGTIQKQLNIGDIILAMSASGDSFDHALQQPGMHFAATADFDLLYQSYQIAERLGIKTHPGSVFTANAFYDAYPNRWDTWQKHGILGVDMETQMLYILAKRHDAKALSILTVSDNILTRESASAQDREQSYMNMMRMGLALA